MVDGEMISKMWFFSNIQGTRRGYHKNELRPFQTRPLTKMSHASAEPGLHTDHLDRNSKTTTYQRLKDMPLFSRFVPLKTKTSRTLPPKPRFLGPDECPIPREANLILEVPCFERRRLLTIKICDLYRGVFVVGKCLAAECHCFKNESTNRRIMW